MTGTKQRIQTDFDSLVARETGPLLKIARRMLGNWDDARDAVQDALFAVWRAGGDFSAELAPARVRRALINRCIDLLRRRRLLAFFSLTGTAQQPASDLTATDGGELERFLEAAVDKLKPKQKAAFILRALEGYTVREAARALGCSENSVLTNLHLARKNLRKWLKPYIEA